MGAMRGFAAVALAAAALITAGCGASAASTGSSSSVGAASLVPADATAYAYADLSASFPGRDLLTGDVGADEVAVARLKRDTVMFAKTENAGKLRARAAKDHQTVEKIGDWYVVASSHAVFDRVRAAESGTSLADSAAFQRAWSGLPSDAVARLYAPNKGLIGSARADGDALRIAATSNANSSFRVAPSPLLRDVPSGSALAVAFHGTGATALLEKAGLARLAPLLQGDGVLYVRPAGLLPEIAVELATPTPQRTYAKVQALLQQYRTVLGPIQLTAAISGDKVIISDGPAAAAALRGGPKLVDDAAYKDAVKAAGTPSQTAAFVYADVTALAPFVELAAQAATGKAVDPQLGTNLGRVGTTVAWVTRRGTGIELHAWLRPH